MMTRIITGTVLGVIALLVVVHGGLVFFGLMLLLGLLALNEFYRLTRLYRPLALPGFAGLVALLCLAWFSSSHGLLGGVALAALLAALGGFLVGAKPGVTVRVAVTLLGVLYVGLGFATLLLLRRVGLPDHPGAEGGAWLVGMTVFGAWGGDTMAYFIGKYFGHTPMAPNLSPKKTWEGFAGGALGTILLVVFIGFMMGYQSDGWSAGDGFLLGLVIAVAGPLGDLFESLIKRDVQIKDSGRGLPGHGGVLDRFDALLWASVVAYFLVTSLLGF
jgi:phosphatidate cytidylyltransferase